MILLVSLVACSGEKKTVHCDNCGKAVEIDADSDMEEDWIIYCRDCEHELGLDTVVRDGE